MGTQFTSRLTSADCRKLLSDIRRSQKSEKAMQKPAPKASVKAKSKGKAAKKATGIPGRGIQMIQDEVVAAVVEILDQRHFFKDIRLDDLFVHVLRWLTELRSDAQFNGFEGIIRKYNLASEPSPIRILQRELREIVTPEPGFIRGPFATAVVAAAKAVFAAVLTYSVKIKPVSISPAQELGGKFAKMTQFELVRIFAQSFMVNCVHGVISRADPDKSDPSRPWAEKATQKAIERASKRAMTKIQREGVIPEAVREIVASELEGFLNGGPLAMKALMNEIEPDDQFQKTRGRQILNIPALTAPAEIQPVEGGISLDRKSRDNLEVLEYQLSLLESEQDKLQQSMQLYRKELLSFHLWSRQLLQKM